MWACTYIYMYTTADVGLHVYRGSSCLADAQHTSAYVIRMLTYADVC